MSQITFGNFSLSDLRVMDLSEVFSGPVAGLILSDLGAEVIKVEPPEWKRTLVTRMAQRDDPVFIAYNRGKKSMVLDLTLPEGKEVFRALVKKSDVVLYNFSPSVVHKLGLHYDELGKINPKIICCSITGYGLEGKNIERPAFDLTIQAVSGIMDLTGEPERSPVRAAVPIADATGGLLGAIGILAAYAMRQKTQMGQQIDISMFDGALLGLCHVAMDYFLNGVIPERMGWYSTAGRRADYRGYKTRDGYIVVATGRGEDKWQAICKALGKEELGTDPRFNFYKERIKDEKRVIVEQIFEPIFLTKSTEEWLEILGKEDIPCAPVNRLNKTLEETEVSERGMIIPLELPSGKKIKAIGNPIKMGAVKESYKSVPEFGEHTREVLQNILNYSEEEVNHLANKKVVVLGDDSGEKNNKDKIFAKVT